MAEPEISHSLDDDESQFDVSLMHRGRRIIGNDIDISSAQKGKVTEALVASTLILASTGRLSPFVPMSDDCGIDLIILDKTTHRTIALQVKSRIAHPTRQTVQFNVRKASFGDAGNRYLLGVLFDPVNIALTASWLIPMSRVREVSVEKAEVYSLTPNTAIGSRDRYQEFRLHTAGDLSDAVVRAIAQEDPAAANCAS